MADPLGPLAPLLGKWKGAGFNAIWRPHNLASGQGRFLELNLTNETLVFSRVNGPIPNRGLLMPDINMFGVTYMQQVAEASSGVGLHVESGAWLRVPQTTNPQQPPSVVRMACMLHGAAVLTQGVAQVHAGGLQGIPDSNILPFVIGDPAPLSHDFASVAVTFSELDLSVPTAFRMQPAGVTQEMVKNPNSVLETALKTALEDTTMNGWILLHVSTTERPLPGGGTASTAFLQGLADPPGGNARATEVETVVWIQTIAGRSGQPDTHQLQYTQRVMLDFNGIRWPHVNVATLQKR